MNFSKLKNHATNIRKNILVSTHLAGSGHVAGPMGAADLLAYLFLNVLQVGTKFNLVRTNYANDKFILSCGHYAPALYSTLAECEIISFSELNTLRDFGSRLQGHTKRQPEIFIENTSGSLGQGIGLAVGEAIYFKRSGLHNKVYVMISDGELNEGSCWESFLIASKFSLDNLVILIDRNGIQQSGKSNDQLSLEPLDEKLRSFNLNVHKINGNNFEDIEKAFTNLESDKVNVILSYTTPGKGVDFLENNYKWHSKVLNSEELNKAIEQLSK